MAMFMAVVFVLGESRTVCILRRGQLVRYRFKQDTFHVGPVHRHV